MYAANALPCEICPLASPLVGCTVSKVSHHIISAESDMNALCRLWGVFSYMTSISAILLVGSLSLSDSNGFAPILKMLLHKDVRCGSPPLSVWQISLFASGRRMDDKRERGVEENERRGAFFHNRERGRER